MFAEYFTAGKLAIGAIVVAAPIIWQGGVQIAQITENGNDVAELRAEYNQHEGDAIDRLGRIETKIDILMEKN